jgi:hypothetical protein
VYDEADGAKGSIVDEGAAVAVVAEVEVVSDGHIMDVCGWSVKDMREE